MESHNRFQLGFPLGDGLGVLAAHLEDTALRIVRIHANMDFIVGILGRRYKATSRNVEFSLQQISRLVGVVLQSICFQYKETVLPLGKDGFRTQTRRLFKNRGAYCSKDESVKVQITSNHNNSIA